MSFVPEDLTVTLPPGTEPLAPGVPPQPSAPEEVPEPVAEPAETPAETADEPGTEPVEDAEPTGDEPLTAIAGLDASSAAISPFGLQPGQALVEQDNVSGPDPVTNIL